MAVLLAAKHVTGSAEFEVESGDSKASAEFAELFHGGEAFAGDVGERSVRRDEEIGVGALGGTADATAQLVNLGRAEAHTTVHLNITLDPHSQHTLHTLV